MAGKKKQIATELLELDERLQCRAEVPKEILDEYADAWKAGVKFPEVVVYQVDDRFLVVDGFCRVVSAQSIGKSKVPCVVHQGTFKDALRAACGANVSHGLRRTNADKNKAARIAIENFPELSSREIGDLCGVSHAYVQNLRKPKEAKPEVEPETHEEKPESTKKTVEAQEPSDVITVTGWNCPDCGSDQQRLTDGGYVCRRCLLPVQSEPEVDEEQEEDEPEEVETFPARDPEKVKAIHTAWGRFIRAVEAAGCSDQLGKDIDSMTIKLGKIR